MASGSGVGIKVIKAVQDAEIVTDLYPVSQQPRASCCITQLTPPAGRLNSRRGQTCKWSHAPACQMTHGCDVRRTHCVRAGQERRRAADTRPGGRSHSCHHDDTCLHHPPQSKLVTCSHCACCHLAASSRHRLHRKCSPQRERSYRKRK